jgi:4-amino-4-deoxy-L-arabinose transferase-like glycosyltransferase
VTATSRTRAARQAAAPPPSPPSRIAGRRLATIGVAAAIACGLLLRVWALGRSPVTSDQAVVGLMAREILRGHLPVFYWGQDYGGGEPYVVAALFAALGQSRLVLGLAPLLLDGVAAVLVWRLGRRLFGARAGVVAGLLFWLWPEVYVYLSTVEYGFRYMALVCGLALLLCCARLAQARGRRLRDWAGAGLALGVGWWSSPEIVYFALPALVMAAPAMRRDRRVAVGALLGAAGATLGALPWLVFNVGHGFVSLHAARFAHPPLAARAHDLVLYVVPMVLGLRLRSSGDWLGGSTFGVVATCLVAGLLLVWLLRLATRRRALPLVAFVLTFPVVYLASPYSGYWRDGRYALYLAPVLALLVGSGLDAAGRRLAAPGSAGPPQGPWREWLLRSLPALGVAGALAATLTAAAGLSPYTPLRASDGSRTGWTTWRSDPDVWQRALLAALERTHIRYAYASYWIAYSLSFEAHGRVTAVDPSVDRYPPYLALVDHSARPTWIFVRPAAVGALDAAAGPHDWVPGPAWQLDAFEASLQRLGDPCRVIDAGPFAIVYPRYAIAASFVRIARANPAGDGAHRPATGRDPGGGPAAARNVTRTGASRRTWPATPRPGDEQEDEWGATRAGASWSPCRSSPSWRSSSPVARGPHRPHRRPRPRPPVRPPRTGRCPIAASRATSSCASRRPPRCSSSAARAPCASTPPSSTGSPDSRPSTPPCRTRRPRTSGAS